LNVARERAGSEKFRQCAAREAPTLVHLKQPITGVHPTLHEVEIGGIAREDMVDAVSIPRDLHVGLKPGYGDRRCGKHPIRSEC
jgi:hypothetical protein